MSPRVSFYRRPLPEGQVAFSSPEGRRLFREALERGTLESFFALSEQFHTQAEPAYCGLGSLVVALNALGIDPGRLWKGPWRWFDETLLDCCVPLEEVRTRGLTLDELGCLASCNGARVTLVRAQDASADELRAALVRAAHTSDRVLVASYDRGALDQTGSGHFSPIGGVHEARDLALLLDVARFKYPPHWVPIERLFRAMLPLDPATERSRGWLELVAAARPRPIFLQLGVPAFGWTRMFQRLRAHAGERTAIENWAVAMTQHVPELREVVHTLAEALGRDLEPEHRRLVDALLAQIRETPVYRAILEHGASTLAGAALAPEVLAVLAHVLAPAELLPALMPSPLAEEIGALRSQVDALCASQYDAT